MINSLAIVFREFMCLEGDSHDSMHLSSNSMHRFASLEPLVDSVHYVQPMEETVDPSAEFYSLPHGPVSCRMVRSFRKTCKSVWRSFFSAGLLILTLEVSTHE